jgi:hypothetical protein
MAEDTRIEITHHIRVLWGAEVEVDGEKWTGWAVWDDYAEECPVYRTSAEAVTAAKQIAAEYAIGERG